MSTCSDVMPFVIHEILNGEFDGLVDHQNNEIDPESDLAKITIGSIIKNWKMIGMAVKIGKKGRLYADEWEKDKFKVFTLNESEYDSVGVFNIAVCSYDKQSLEEFVKDFDLKDIQIEETEAVQQTL